MTKLVYCDEFPFWFFILKNNFVLMLLCVMILYLLPYLANLHITLIICIRTIFSKEDLFFHIFGKKFGRVRVWFNKEWHMNNMGDNKGKTCIIGGICNKDYMEINEGIFSPLNWSSYTVKFFLNFWKDNSINTQVYVLVFLLFCVFVAIFWPYIYWNLFLYLEYF